MAKKVKRIQGKMKKLNSNQVRDKIRKLLRKSENEEIVMTLLKEEGSRVAVGEEKKEETKVIEIVEEVMNWMRRSEGVIEGSSRKKRIGNFEKFIHPELTKKAKFIDSIIILILETSFNRSRIVWKEIQFWMLFRVKLLRWRAEKWTDEILAACDIDFPNLGELFEVVEVVYVMFNLVSKKRYVGETGVKLKTRLKGHKRDFDKKIRRTYKRMSRVEWEEWIIIPIKKVEGGKAKRCEVEREFVEKWRANIINDDSTWFIRSKPRHARGVNDRDKIMQLISDKNNWVKYDEKRLMIAAEYERSCRLPGRLHGIFLNVLVNKMKKVDKRWRVSYGFKIIVGSTSKQATMLIREIINKKVEDSNLKRHINHNLTKIDIPEVTIYQIVKKFMQKDREFKWGSDYRCQCQDFEGFPRNSDGHVQCRVGEIEGHKILRKYLKVNSKTPITPRISFLSA